MDYGDKIRSVFKLTLILSDVSLTLSDLDLCRASFSASICNQLENYLLDQFMHRKSLNYV